MKSTCFITLFLIISTALSAQKSMGLIFDEEALRAIPVLPDYGDGGKSDEDLLGGLRKADLRPYCPLVQDQGSAFSCVGWATGYGAYTIQTAITNGWKDQPERITQNAYSALFIYNQIRGNGCNAGSKIPDALKLMSEKGDMLFSEFEAGQKDCMQMPGPLDLEKARQYRIKDYFSLFHPHDSDLKKILRTKVSLTNQQPVIIAMEIKQNFRQVKRGEQYWLTDLGDTTILGYHAMVVVGFDDGSDSFEIMNSWGTLWGDDGFVKIKYRDFARYCRYAFNLSIYQDDTENSLLSGRVTLQQPLVQNNHILQKPLESAYNGQFYELTEPLPQDARLQLVANELTAGSYLYVFSLDPEGQLKVHWPRDEHLDATFTGRHESAIISGPALEIIIPGPLNALILDKPGIQNLFILLSRKPITNLNQYLQKLQSSNLPVPQRFQAVFPKTQGKSTKIHYDNNGMIFFTPSKEVEIVPVLVQVSVN